MLMTKQAFLPGANISWRYLKKSGWGRGLRFAATGNIAGGPFLELVQKMKEFVFELFIRQEKGMGTAFAGEILLKSKL